MVIATSSGYLQFVRLDALIAISASSHAVIRLLSRPGHFLVEGEPLAHVWPPDAAAGVARVSVGGGFAFTALAALAEAGAELRESGTYGYAERTAAGVKAAREAFERG